MYEVREVLHSEEWEQFNLLQPYTLFVQSAAYIDFYKKMGERGWIFGLYKNGVLIGGSLVVSTHAKRGNFLYLPYGPIIPEPTEEKFLVFFNHLKYFAQKQKFHFVRVSPFVAETPFHQKLYNSVGFRSSPIHVLAENTWLLDISSDRNEEEIFKQMDKNHRNLIRRCEKEGVKVEIRKDKEALQILNDMLDVTAKKHHFHRFSRQFVEQEFSVFADKGEAEIFLSYLPNGQIDAAAIIMFYGTMACYRHSASYYLDKRLPSSYLIQWRVIQEAKRRGIRTYNFWGVAPRNAEKDHPFYGITHFKKGFGGRQFDLLPCHDLSISPRYWITRGIETIRRIKRGF